MREWVELNKEWFLSGAGIFIITSIVAVFSSLLTLYIKYKNESKKRKIISLSTKINKYSIESSDNKSDLNVTYKGITYNNLCQYLIQIKNDGAVGIENQQLLISLPLECELIERNVKLSSQTISYDTEDFKGEDKTEYLYDFHRLEVNDFATISYLLDSEQIENANVQPRGIDGVRYNYKGYENIPEVRVLVFFIALFILVGTFPFIGGAFQALVVLFASPTIVNIVSELKRRDISQKSINIAEVSVDDDAQINIVQK